MWELLEVVGWIVKCTGFYSLLWFSQTAQNWLDSATQEFLKSKKWDMFQWPSHSPDLNPTEHISHVLNTKLKAQRPTYWRQLQTWQSILGTKTGHLVMFMGSTLQRVTDCRWFFIQILKTILIFKIMLVYLIECLKKGGLVLKAVIFKQFMQYLFKVPELNLRVCSAVSSWMFEIPL